jgi:hypothetical protein
VLPYVGRSSHCTQSQVFVRILIKVMFTLCCSWNVYQQEALCIVPAKWRPLVVDCEEEPAPSSI